jgi:hypothetical protein
MANAFRPVCPDVGFRGCGTKKGIKWKREPAYDLAKRLQRNTAMDRLSTKIDLVQLFHLTAGLFFPPLQRGMGKKRQLKTLDEKGCGFFKANSNVSANASVFGNRPRRSIKVTRLMDSTLLKIYTRRRAGSVCKRIGRSGIRLDVVRRMSAGNDPWQIFR